MAAKYGELPSKETYAESTSSSNESHEALLHESDSDCERLPKASSSRQSLKLVVVFLASISISALSGLWVGSRYLTSPDSAIRYVQRYSPIVKEVDMSYHTHRFNGSLLKANAFRQDAGPEVDAAWESLGVDYRAVVIPASEAAQSGLTPDQVQVNKKYGGGFPANVEGLHHLHCLNLLRKSLYYNHEYYANMHHHAFANDDRVVKFHLTHCLDIIRQQLMCTVDVGVLGQVWWNREEPEAYVDFNTKHQCRNFEAIREWAKERQMPDDVPEDYLQPPRDGDVLATIP